MVTPPPRRWEKRVPIQKAPKIHQPGVITPGRWRCGDGNIVYFVTETRRPSSPHCNDLLIPPDLPLS